MQLSRFINDYRLSQREIADIIGCHPSNISNIVKEKRNLTGLHIRLLIEKYGYDVIAKYAEPGEMPAPPSNSVNITMQKTGDNSPATNGNGNSITTADVKLLEALNKALDQNSKMLEQNSKSQEQIDRLISLLENK